MKELYLDSNAHVPMGDKALETFVNFNKSSTSFGHALSPSKIGQKTSKAIEDAREKIAKLIGAKNKNQIFFTNGCTQACEWAINILLNLNKTEKTATSKMEHPAVSRAVKKYIKNIFNFRVDKDGIINYELEALKAICIYVQNEIGTIQDLNKIKAKYLFSDMSQALGKIPINVSDLPVDIAVFGAHKFGGPTNVGFMYLKNTEHWREFGTGSRYFMDIPGTPDAAGIVSTAAALEDAIDTMEERTNNMVEFQSLLEMGLKEMNFEIVGEKAIRVPNTTFVKVPSDKFHAHSGFMLMTELSNNNVYVGLGSACGSLYTDGSPLMKSLGRPSNGQDYIRISQWGNYDIHCAKELLFTIQRILK